MKIVYVIDAGGYSNDVLKAKKALLIDDDVEVIFVESREDIPIKDRISSDPTIIQEIHKLVARPVMPDVCLFVDKKKKSHERPYKFHK